MELFLKIYRVSGPNGPQLQLAAFETMKQACKLVHPTCSIARLHLSFAEKHDWQVLEVKKAETVVLPKKQSKKKVKPTENLTLEEGLASDPCYKKIKPFPQIATITTAAEFTWVYSSLTKKEKVYLAWYYTAYKADAGDSDILWVEVYANMKKVTDGILDGEQDQIKYKLNTTNVLSVFNLLPKTEQLRVFRDYLFSDISWSDTPQGHDYWVDIYDKISHKIKQQEDEAEPVESIFFPLKDVPVELGNSSEFLEKYSELTKVQQQYILWYAANLFAHLFKHKSKLFEDATINWTEIYENLTTNFLPILKNLSSAEKSAVIFYPAIQDFKLLSVIDKLKTFNQFLNFSFTWGDTLQGSDYWVNLSCKLNKLTLP